MNKIPKWIRAVYCVLFPTRGQEIDYQEKYGGLTAIDNDSCLETLIVEGRQQADLLRDAFSIKRERAKQLITFGSLIWGGKFIGILILNPRASWRQAGYFPQICSIVGVCLTFIGLIIAITLICQPQKYQIVVLKALAEKNVHEKAEIIKAYSDLQVNWEDAQLMDTIIEWGTRFIVWGGICYTIGLVRILI